MSHEERCRALTEELDDLRSKLTETTEEGRRAAKAELAELGSRLEEAERALSRRDKALADLNSQANEYESDRSARIDQMRHIEAKLTEVETVKDTVVRELKVLGVESPEAEPNTTRNYGPSGLRCSLRLQGDIVNFMCIMVPAPKNNLVLADLLRP